MPVPLFSEPYGISATSLPSGGKHFALATSRRLIHEAVQEVEDEKDKHLFRAAGWSRELWLQSLGLPAMVPPPEDVEKKFKTAAGSGHTRQRRKPMIN